MEMLYLMMQGDLLQGGEYKGIGRTQGCCHPIPGDDALGLRIRHEDSPLFAEMKDECLDRLKGYLAIWTGIEIHKLTKEQAQKHYSEFVK